MKIYLAGPVPKGDKEAEGYIDWRKKYTEILSKHADIAELYDPNVFYRLEGDSKAVAGADCLYISQSDVVIVNAEEKIGAGTSMECVVAKYFSKPVVTVLPKNSYHRRANLEFQGRTVEDWVHPFIETFSDFIVEGIGQAPDVLAKLKDAKIKNITVIDDAIAYAKDRQ